MCGEYSYGGVVLQSAHFFSLLKLRHFLNLSSHRTEQRENWIHVQQFHFPYLPSFTPTFFYGCLITIFLKKRRWRKKKNQLLSETNLHNSNDSTILSLTPRLFFMQIVKTVEEKSTILSMNINVIYLFKSDLTLSHIFYFFHFELLSAIFWLAWVLNKMVE